MTCPGVHRVSLISKDFVVAQGASSTRTLIFESLLSLGMPAQHDSNDVIHVDGKERLSQDKKNVCKIRKQENILLHFNQYIYW
jgi:hypothetical protein